MKIVLSTRNPSKAEQIKAVFKDSIVSILTLDEAGIEGQGIEDGITLKENALKKAMFAHEQDSTVWTMADDTGIFIDALNGLPGVDTALWTGGAKTTEEITLYVLEQLKGIADRSATFETVVAIVSPDGEQHFFSGKVRGKLLEVPKGAIEPKMPYGQIFVPDGFNIAFAEMTAEQKNNVSHRGKAFRQAREFIEKLIIRPL